MKEVLKFSGVDFMKFTHFAFTDVIQLKIYFIYFFNEITAIKKQNL